MPISCHFQDCKGLDVFIVEQRYIKYPTFTFYLYTQQAHFNLKDGRLTRFHVILVCSKANLKLLTLKNDNGNPANVKSVKRAGPGPKSERAGPNNSGTVRNSFNFRKGVVRKKIHMAEVCSLTSAF